MSTFDADENGEPPVEQRPRVSSVGFTRSTEAEFKSGLIAWLTCVIDDAVMLDGLTLRRTLDGRLTISYPARRDRSGRVERDNALAASAAGEAPCEDVNDEHELAPEEARWTG